VLGLSDQLSLTGFAGDASWAGYAMVSGHWYSAPGEVDVNTAFLDATGAGRVGTSYAAHWQGRAAGP
jgi:putative ABC transport system permease protein